MALWQTIRSSYFSRHCHDAAYAAIVLSGAYEEAGDQGRFTVTAGDVLFHTRFEAHINRFGGSGAVVLNLPIPPGTSCSSGTARLSDPDSIIRLAESSPTQAAHALLSAAYSRAPATPDWPDELAFALLANPSLCLSQWSGQRGLKPWVVSRGFKQVFALSPSAFRARARARHAWRTITANHDPLANVAANLEFADQAHMTRSVKQLTGKTPRAWRACK